jgi:hypothetical protein
MLIQATSPRPIFNASENPAHIRIHTLRKPRVSKGEVTLVLGEKRMEVEPVVAYPIQGEAEFEALEYFLPFWKVFGPKPVYDENAIQRKIESNNFKRVTVGEKKDKLLVSKDDEGIEKLTGVQLALLGAAGYAVIIKSAYRTEGAAYDERTLNFTIHCPINGGGIIRVADCPLDIANPTFDPHEPMVENKRQDLVLLEAFNRTHRLRTDDIEERKRKRIADAEANMRANSEKLLGEGSTSRLIIKE